MLSLTLRCGAEYFLDGLLVETILSNLGATDLAAVAATCSSLRRPCEAVAATSLRLLLVRMQTEPVRAELVRGAIARLMLWELIAADCHLWLQADERYLTLAERFGTSYVQACADRSGSGHGAYSHLNGPEFLPDALHGCGVFLFDGAAVLKTRPFTEPIPQPITLMVVAKARGDTTIIDALGTSSSRFELCHGYPTGWHPSPEICITASGHDAPPQRSLRGSTRGTGEWHIYTAVFDARRSELYVDGSCEATGKSVGGNRLDGLSIGCDHNGVFFLIGAIAEVRLFRCNLPAAARVAIELGLAHRYGLEAQYCHQPPPEAPPSPSRSRSRFCLRTAAAAAGLRSSLRSPSFGASSSSV
mmetsp:Transcript_4354/g.13990  ORF Transcript_4354/g.13990 Transcript_4354/m.13990 type:complete len:359 (+) Transcript_4354:41-1117(+)